ncbi:MAG: hypothetical protein ACE5IO_10105 [Thermoplasmata archaeon]
MYIFVESSAPFGLFSDQDVSSILSQYDIEENVIYQVREKVKKMLEKEGVVFNEDS